MHTSLHFVFPSNTNLVYVTLPTYVLAMLLTQQGRQSKLNITIGVAQNNGFPQHVIQRLYGYTKIEIHTNTTLATKIKKMGYLYIYSPAITEVTNLFQEGRFTNSPEHSSPIT